MIFYLLKEEKSKSSLVLQQNELALGLINNETKGNWHYQTVEKEDTDIVDEMRKQLVDKIINRFEDKMKKTDLIFNKHHLYAYYFKPKAIKGILIKVYQAVSEFGIIDGMGLLSEWENIPVEDIILIEKDTK